MGTMIVSVILAAVVAAAAMAAWKKFTRGGGCCPEREAEEKRVKVRDRDRSHYPYKVTLKIDGMTCSNCARRVENALNSMEGVWVQEISFGEGIVRMLCKEEPELQEVRRKVAEAGYTVLRVLP